MDIDPQACNLQELWNNKNKYLYENKLTVNNRNNKL